MAIEKFADTPNQGITVLDGPLSDSATTIPVDSMADLKLTGLTGNDFAYCKITKKANWRQHPINRKETFEIVKVTAVSGNDLTATRGVDGTSGTAFDTQDIVEVVFSNIEFQHLVAALTDGTKELNIGAATFRGDVTISHGSNPSLLLAEFAGSPFRIRDQTASGARIVKISDSAGAVINIDCDPLDGTSAALIRLFREQTNTTGSRKFEIYRGDGSTDVTFQVDAASGEVTANDIIGLGDTYWVGAGTGLPYGSMYMFQGSTTVTVSSANEWEELTSGLIAGARLNLIIFQNSHELVVTKAGEYDIFWSASVQTASAQQEVMGGVTIDSADANTAVGSSSTCIKATANHGTIVAANKSIPLSGGTTCQLTAGQVLSLCFLNESGTADIVVEHVNFKAIMVGG